ncbi:MAG: beta-propeller domain-containing protein [Myxococcales bacterium]
MAYRATNRLPTLIGTGLLLGLLGTGCGSSTADEHGDNDVDALRGSNTKAALLRAQDCDDLLSKLQADAIIKVKLEAARAIAQFGEYARHGGGFIAPGEAVDDGLSGSLPDSDLASPQSPSAAPPSDVGSNAGAPTPSGGAVGDSAGEEAKGPDGASETNNQVKGVDEADFVKVVRMGESMFVLNGNTLYKLDTWPAADTSLSSSKLLIEGSPTEMFVTDAGKAVVFSTVYGYGNGGGVDGGVKNPATEASPPPSVGLAQADVALCAPVPVDAPVGVGVTDTAPNATSAPDSARDAGAASAGSGGATMASGATPKAAYYGGGCGGYYLPVTKITVVDVSGSDFRAEREIYYEGNYLSSRRYGDVVRVVLQAEGAFNFIQGFPYYDNQGNMLSRSQFERAVAKSVAAAEAQIRKQTLKDWLPSVQEAKLGQLETIEPTCENFFVPVPGLSGYGLTHVLSLDLTKGGDVGGVTVMGSAQTVYSNLDTLVLAQPDYRWGPAVDFGFVDEQLLNVHKFSIKGADTIYDASGSVSGVLPPNNAQFGIDVKGDVLRLATTGRVRTNPEAEPESLDFWNFGTTNHVFALQQAGGLLKVVGKSENLGHEGESLQSARFVGDRAYVVTFRQTDPLVVLDLKNPAQLSVLGQIEIPGFSQYMHPLDDNHLITFGTSGTFGFQLQLFDVTNPAQGIPAPKVLDYGSSSSSEAQYNHKALTFFPEQNLVALPLYSYGDGYSSNFSSTLQLLKVDAVNGFTKVGEVDHSALYQEQSADCVKCYNGFCQYVCYNNYSPEVRRGHFVTGEGSTFVYSFSYAGVIVNDLSNLTDNLAEVPFPTPAWGSDSWYGGVGGINPVPPTNVGSGGATDPGAPTAGAAVDAGAAPSKI